MEYIDQRNMILIKFITHSFTSMQKIEVSTGHEVKHLEEGQHLHVNHSCDKARKTVISTKPKRTHPNPERNTTIFPTSQFLIRERKIQEIYVSHVGVTLQATLKNNLWYKNRIREMEES